MTQQVDPCPGVPVQAQDPLSRRLDTRGQSQVVVKAIERMEIVLLGELVLYLRSVQTTPHQRAFWGLVTEQSGLQKAAAREAFECWQAPYYADQAYLDALAQPLPARLYRTMGANTSRSVPASVKLLARGVSRWGELLQLFAKGGMKFIKGHSHSVQPWLEQRPKVLRIGMAVPRTWSAPSLPTHLEVWLHDAHRRLCERLQDDGKARPKTMLRNRYAARQLEELTTWSFDRVGDPYAHELVKQYGIWPGMTQEEWKWAVRNGQSIE